MTVKSLQMSRRNYSTSMYVGYCSFSKAVSPVREQTDGNLNLAVRQPKPNP